VFHNGGRETHLRGVWVEGMVEVQITSSLAVIGPWVVMTTHQSPCSGSCLGEGGLFMPLQVLAPDMPNILREGFHAQNIFRLKLVRTLLLRKSLHNETLDTGKVVCFGEMVQEPDDCAFIDEIIKFG
jgi:hypothetical protein